MIDTALRLCKPVQSGSFSYTCNAEYSLRRAGARLFSGRNGSFPAKTDVFSPEQTASGINLYLLMNIYCFRRKTIEFGWKQLYPARNN
jgi:hypothetical protein